ncbi:acyltransferase family protein [Parasediminibacterium sp. JCM 36343]|uniref:acyltransferase family protein n=1 Tax=Parasediminibacterium sp. JCM 36343 TaxID=3374279 RepID=UPI003979074B
MLKSNHISKIDSLRGIALLSVFLYHSQLCIATIPEVKKYNANGIIAVHDLYEIISTFSPISFGWSGVELFLLISGFLIHYGYLQNSTNFQILSFYSRRFWRIYPPYFIVFLTFYLGTKGISYFLLAEGKLDFVLHALLIHNLRSKFFFGINPSFWSLALEMQLYILYPIIIYLRKKIGIKNVFYLLLSMSICFFLTGLILQEKVAFFKSPTFDLSPLKLWFVWVGGAFLAERYNNKTLLTKNSTGLVILFALLTILSKSFIYTSHLTMYFVTSFWFFVFAGYLKTRRVNKMTFVDKSLGFVGLCSYSFYLLHQPLLYFMYNFLNKIPLFYQFTAVKVLPVFFLLLIMSYLMFHVLEKPSIALGKFLMKKIK